MARSWARDVLTLSRRNTYDPQSMPGPMRPKIPPAALLIILSFLSVPLGGCIWADGNQTTEPTNDEVMDLPSNNTTLPEAVVLEVAAVGIYPGNPAFDPATMSAEAGTLVSVVFTNNDGNPLGSHDWAIEGFEDTTGTEEIGVGETSTVNFTVPSQPGDLVYYCTVPGHRGRGMEGIFTVTGEAATGDDNSTEAGGNGTKAWR